MTSTTKDRQRRFSVTYSLKNDSGLSALKSTYTKNNQKHVFDLMIDYLIALRNQGMIDDDQFKAIIVEVTSNYISGQVEKLVESKLERKLIESVFKD